MKRLALLILVLTACSSAKNPTAPVSDTTCICTGEHVQPLPEEK